VVFFAAQSLAGLNTFSARLGAIAFQFGPTVRGLIDRRLASLGTARDVYSPIYDHAASVNAKSFIILMVISFAAVTWALFLRSKRASLTDLVFALHFYAFLLLVGCFVTVAERATEAALGRWSVAWDSGFAAAALLACAVYLYAAAARVYGVTGVGRILCVGVWLFSTASIWIAYRFVVFLITLYTTGL
jgi:hypothetical protein